MDQRKIIFIRKKKKYYKKMNQRKIKCVCKEEFKEEEYTGHYYGCKQFKQQFKEFDSKLGELLKRFSEPKENLLIIKFLLKQYINVIDIKIKKYFDSLIQNQPPKIINISILQEDNDLPLCQNCKVPDIMYLSCLHPICRECFIKKAEKNYYDMKCNICQEIINEPFKRMILGEAMINELEKKYIKSAVQDLIKCPNCGEKIAFEEGQVDYNAKDEQNQILSKEAAEDYAKHRCRCPMCNKDFCINPNCKAIPYHLGKTCDDFKRLKDAVICRFCDKEIKGDNKGPDDDVCNENE